MGDIWLLCCADADAVRARGEMRAHGARAHCVRVATLRDVEDMVRAFSTAELHVALSARDCAAGELRRVIEAASRAPNVRDVTVIADDPEPGAVAQWFYAGATEVIAAGGAGASADADTEACAGGEPDDVSAVALPAGDDDAGEGTGSARDTSAGACTDDAPMMTGPWVKGTSADKRMFRGAEAGRTVVPLASGAHAAAGMEGGRAPVVTAIAGRGGCGKTTLVASMAACAAHAGLRAAMLDLDLMFGNLAEVFSVDVFKGIEDLTVHAGEDGEGALVEEDIEATAMRIGPGLTLWGPCEHAERAELVAQPVERLIETLRGVADVIFIDTSGHWGDAVAMAVSTCDRCLVVGGPGPSMVTSARRAVGLATSLGVPRTRMTCAFNRLGLRGCGEEQAMKFEMGVALHSRVRIADGGEEVAGMFSFGHIDALVSGQGTFARSVRMCTGELLRELGCPANAWLLADAPGAGDARERPRLRLPWRQRAGELR